METSNGNLHRISAFCKEAMIADARAFSVMMKRIKEIDKEQTVIAVQINNEVGIKQDIDYGKESLKLFQSPVPTVLLDYLAKN